MYEHTIFHRFMGNKKRGWEKRKSKKGEIEKKREKRVRE